MRMMTMTVLIGVAVMTCHLQVTVILVAKEVKRN